MTWKIELSECKGFPALILQGVYSCADVCLSSLTLNLWGWVDVAGCDGSCLAGWYWWLPQGNWKAKGMCVWVGNSCAYELMTTCVVSAWFMDIQDLSLLQDLWTGWTGCSKYPKHLLYITIYVSFRRRSSEVLWCLVPCSDFKWGLIIF